MKNPSTDGLQREASDVASAALKSGRFAYKATAAFGAMTLATLATTKVLKKLRDAQEEAPDEPIEEVTGEVVEEA